ncbi:hypothetical protein PsYK624_172260 [Phanerochaete sordida]|uniref:Uncharacterized protein n=1 Tax=Phanerochaete sordida TaxID=48140 RepID=A0A9P3GTQ5_9APHY|nr:hypothetical protein PsYK624_172260 [Phanerochaete sordida]
MPSTSAAAHRLAPLSDDTRAKVIQEPPAVHAERACAGRRDGKYEVLARVAVAGDLGGAGSISTRYAIAKELFPYKWDHLLPLPANDGNAAMQVNRANKIAKFTGHETARLGLELLSYSCWYIDGIEPTVRSVRSRQCQQRFTPEEDDSIPYCGACKGLDAIKGLQRHLRRAAARDRADAELTADDRKKIELQRASNTPILLTAARSAQLKKWLSDPYVQRAWKYLERGEFGSVFIDLYQQAQDGKLADKALFVKISEALADRIQREHSGNPNAKYGIRYDQDVLNFFIAMRGYGAQSAAQYNLLSEVIGGVCERRLRAITSKATEAMDSPDLTAHNVARLARDLKKRGYERVPVALSMDCTVLRGKLLHSTEFGSHILGSVEPLSAVEVRDRSDIDRIIEGVVEKGALASQVRVLVGKAAMHGCSTIPLAIPPTQGKDTAEDNAALLLKCIQFCAKEGIAVISCGADGASNEQGAHDILNASPAASDYLVFTIEKFGITVRIPVFPVTGPLVTIPDPGHVQKVLRNNEQSGTHCLSLNENVLTHDTLVSLQKEKGSGMVLKDVVNTDKQDDGAAIRLFHSNALAACMNAEGTIDPQYRMAFAVHFVFGELFDAVFKRDLSHFERVRAVLRAKFFLKIWRDHIAEKNQSPYGYLFLMRRSFLSSQNYKSLNHLCDALIKLVIVHSEFYPNVPFLPWQHGSMALEKLFGIARTFIPNFTYVEFIVTLRHVLLRESALLRLAQCGVHEKKEKTSGYVHDTTLEQLTEESLKKLSQLPSRAQICEIAVVAFDEVIALMQEPLGITKQPSLPFTFPELVVGYKQKARRKEKEPVAVYYSDDDEDDEDAVEDEDEDDAAEDEASELDSEDEREMLDALAANDANELRDGLRNMPDDSQQVRDLFHIARLSALMEDLHAEELAAAEGLAEPPVLLRPDISNLLNADPVPARLEEVYKLQPILRPSDKSIDLDAVIRLRRAHDRKSGVLSEKTFELKPRYAEYEPKKLAEATKALGDAAPVDKGDLSTALDANACAPLTRNEIQHRLRFEASTNDALQALMHKRKGGFSRPERWTNVKAAQSASDVDASTSTGKGRITPWALAKTITAAVPHVDTLLPNLATRGITLLNRLRKGSWVVVQTKDIRYVGRVEAIFKKNGTAKGNQHCSTSDAGPSDIASLTNIPMRVFVECEPGEDVNRFRHHTRVTGALWHHATAKEIVYHLGPSAMDESSSGRLGSLKDWAYERWSTLGRQEIQQLICAQYKKKKRTKKTAT